MPSNPKKTMRQFAISDIHGCARTFEALLDQIALSTQDELYLLGDYIDRGPDSKGVLDLIFRLQREGYQLQCLMGNHEEMLLNELSSRSFGRSDAALLRSFDCEKNEQIPSLYIKFMQGLPYYLEIDGYLLVHGGLNFKVPDPLRDTDSMAWIRNWYGHLDRDWLRGRIIVHGHTPQEKAHILGSLDTLDEVPAINIDNGCVFDFDGFGSLCALDLTDRRLFFQARVE
jgi:serine/threonine protein phosphatase 1